MKHLSIPVVDTIYSSSISLDQLDKQSDKIQIIPRRPRQYDLVLNDEIIHARSNKYHALHLKTGKGKVIVKHYLIINNHSPLMSLEYKLERFQTDKARYLFIDEQDVTKVKNAFII